VDGQEGNRFDCSQCKNGFRLKNGICSGGKWENTHFLWNIPFKKDIDECKEPKGSANYHGCHPKAKCLNKIGFHLCQCLVGYAGDGRHCVDIDECKGMMGNEREEEDGQIERNRKGKMEGELLENGGNEKEGSKNREKGQTGNRGEIGRGQEKENRNENRKENQTLRNGKGVGNRFEVENGTGKGEGNGTGGEGNNGRRIEGENSKINEERRKGNGKEDKSGEESHNSKEGGRRKGNVGGLEGNGKENGNEEGNGNNGSGENQQIGNGRNRIGNGNNRIAGRPNQNGKEAGKENQKGNGTVDVLDGRSEGNGQNGKDEENGFSGNETGGRGNGQIGRIKEGGEGGSKRREGGGQWPQSQCHPQAICENLEVLFPSILCRSPSFILGFPSLPMPSKMVR
jgi:hypothetical protein